MILMLGSPDLSERQREQELHDQPVHGLHPRSAWKNRTSQRAIGDAEVVLEHAFDNCSEIGRRFKVTSFVQTGVSETRPVGEDATAIDGAASEQCHRGYAVICALGTVDTHSATKFGDN